MTNGKKKQGKTAKKAAGYKPKPISFWLKFAKAMPDIPESELKPRTWQITREELG